MQISPIMEFLCELGLNQYVSIKEAKYLKLSLANNVHDKKKSKVNWVFI